MYVIKSWTRDFRDEKTRRGDYSCYKEIEYVKTGEYFLGIPLKKPVGKKGTFINDRIIHTYYFKRNGIKFNLKLLSCRFCEDFTEIAYIPDTKSEYMSLKIIALDVIKGKYGNGDERVEQLSKARHNYFKVQCMVNYLLGNVYDLFTADDFEQYKRYELLEKYHKTHTQKVL